MTARSDSVIRAKRILVNIAKYLLLCLAAFVSLVPIVSCIVTAFKTDDEYASTNVMVMPKSWLNFDNFITAWNKADMGHAFLNSFIILVCVLVGSVLISAMLAYVLNRFRFPGNGLIRNLFMIATLIPGIASQVTVYQIMVALHLVNTMPGYIVLMMGTDVISVYIFLQFFENLSVSLDESAILDGCSYFGVFFRILFPLLKGSNWWESVKVGAGAAPIETSEGWLLFYHGVTGTCNGFVYSLGGAILDRDEPSRVLYRCGSFLLTPETWYEERGFVPNVCFPCATLQDAATGRIAVYYGCADSYVGLAFTTADEVVGYIKAHDAAQEADREVGIR